MSVEHPPRILALFGSAVLFGQELGNIEALSALQSTGCEIFCLVRDDDWNKVIPDELARRRFTVVRSPYIEQWMPGRLFFFFFRNPWAFIAANIQLIWVLLEVKPTHIHLFNSLYYLSFVPTLMVYRTPIIYRAGDEPILHNGFWRWVWRSIVGRTTRFVANSQYIRTSLVRSGVAPNRISVIYSRPPSRAGARNPDAFTPPRRSDGLTVTFVGQIAEAKGPHLAVEAMRALAAAGFDARLFVVGRISDWTGDDWARRLRDATLADPTLSERVIFTGYLPDISPVLAVTDVVVTPSLWEEPLANIVMEAKQAARPCVVFPSGGLPEVIQNGVDGFVCADKSAEALAGALRRYCEDTTLAVRHGHAALASLQRFDLDNFPRNWRGVYEAAVGRGARAGALGQALTVGGAHDHDR